MLNIEWKPIKGYEGLYEVSNTGEVRSLNHKRKNIGLTTIDMKKVEENKEELKVAIKETEKDIKELSKSDDELDRKLAKIFGLELGLYKTLINDKENNNE